MKQLVKRYFSTLLRAQQEAIVTCANGVPVGLDRFFETVIEWSHHTHACGGKLMFIGNGGSATIASHMAIDFIKNGGMRALAFNDGAALTCLGNDLGYANVFAKQIEMLASEKDLLVAISSSGNSENILKGVAAARSAGCDIVTMSGFAIDNPLRKLGDLNLYVASQEYGFVEAAHLGLCHAWIDFATGWEGKTNAPIGNVREFAA